MYLTAFQVTVMECYICHEHELDKDRMIVCKNHQFHVECLGLWAGHKKHRMLVCFLCRSQMRYVHPDNLSFRGIFPDIDDEIAEYIKTDNVSALSSKDPHLKKFTRLMELAFYYDSRNILKMLKKNEYIQLSQHFDYYFDYILAPSHKSTCWILDNFDLPKSYIVAKENIVELLMQHERFHELSVIYHFSFQILKHNERLRIATYLFDAITLKRTNLYGLNAISYMARLALSNTSMACYIITKLIPECSMNSIKYVAYDWDLEPIFRKCPNCKSYHFWDILIAAVRTKNFYLVKKSLDFKVLSITRKEPFVGHLLPIPIDLLVKSIKVSSLRDQFVSLFQCNYRFSKNATWKKALRHAGIPIFKGPVIFNKLWN